MRLIYLMAMALSLSACATIPADAPSYSRAVDASPGYENVYIYRIGAYPTLRTPTVAIDGIKVFDPPEKGYTVVSLAKGTHELTVKWSWDTGWPNLTFPFNVTAAAPLYIKISGSFETVGVGQFKAGSLVQVIPHVLAESELTSCCRYIAPHEQVLKTSN